MRSELRRPASPAIAVGPAVLVPGRQLRRPTDFVHAPSIVRTYRDMGFKRRSMISVQAIRVLGLLPIFSLTS